MKFKSLLVGLMLALAGSMAGAGAANATVISKIYTFYAETDGPIGVQNGQFSFDYDLDLGRATLTSLALSLDGIEVTSGTISFRHRDDSFALELRTFVPTLGQYTFSLFFSDGDDFANFIYTLAGTRYWDGKARLTELGDPVEVAEPATLGLIGAGLAGLGLASWRRRRVAA